VNLCLSIFSTKKLSLSAKAISKGLIFVSSYINGCKFVTWKSSTLFVSRFSQYKLFLDFLL
jgi:hypothetical protein